ncbi:MAG: hypothetical protein H0W08_11095 [Acidobacteria bacterium]|nr:hypothetical protein [Acidobacteriota bacterium]
MKVSGIPVLVFALVLGTWTTASTQTPSAPAAPAGATDLYHVQFTKAAPGQAAALSKALMQPDPTTPMPDHFVVLRHQEGDDWDYALIQHLGPKAEVTAAAPPPNPARDLRAWHDDTFVSGPSWAEFTKQMGTSTGGVYAVGVHRVVPGHRDQLLAALNQPAPATSKIQTGTLVFNHVEGGNWTFLSITRYNSWQDFATERAAAATGTGTEAGGWADVRQHTSFHRDTIADRMSPVK